MTPTTLVRDHLFGNGAGANSFLECASCHDDIGRSERPPPGPVARTLNMSTCMECHQKRGVENDCAWCHR